MLIMKFGGAVLQRTQGFRDMFEIVDHDPHRPLLVVVSALGSTTREFSAAAEAARDGKLVQAQQILENIRDYHHAIARELITDEPSLRGLDSGLEATLLEARTLARSISIARQLSARTLDRMLALGEDLSRMLASAYLRSGGASVHEIDARELIVTTDAFGCAEPILDKSRIKAAQHISHDIYDSRVVMVTQGFVGATEDGYTTTMGKESSNLTATFLGALLGATEIVIWTDVEGVRSIDPKHVPVSYVRNALSYKQARNAASQGLKLIYPSMIAPAESANIPIRIASAHHPAADSTMIDDHDHDGVPVIICKDNDDSTTITVMFAQLHAWINALANLPSIVHDSALLSVNVDPSTQACTVVVSNSHASNVLTLLHSQLCTPTHKP